MPRTHMEVENGIEFFDGSEFEGARHHIRLDDFAQGQWYNFLGGTDEFSNRVVTMVWHPPRGVTVTLASLPNGVGRHLEIKNGGVDLNLSEAQDWDDDFESWRWDRRS
ncbi:MAG: hypothetical protein ACREOO_08345 [bacterium]